MQAYDVAEHIQSALSNNTFVFIHQQMFVALSVEVFLRMSAIAAGCLDQIFGDNAKSALITRGLVELKRLFIITVRKMIR